MDLTADGEHHEEASQKDCGADGSYDGDPNFGSLETELEDLQVERNDCEMRRELFNYDFMRWRLSSGTLFSI